MGDINYLRHHMSSGTLSISSTTPGGYTLLHWAACYGQSDLLSMLVQNGADVNVTNDRGETPLHITLKQGRHHECARRLLEFGADPSQPDIEGSSALHIFYNTITAYIVQAHPDVGDTWAQDNKGMTILHYLAWSSRSTSQDLLRCIAADTFSPRGHHPGVHPQLSIKDSQGKSVLHYATQRGNLELITFLLGRPDAASLSMPDHSGCTLLHYATESSRTQTIDLFLSRQFNINAIDDDGRTVLHHACQWGNVKAVKHLIDLGFGYQLDVCDLNEQTPFQLAERYRSDAVVECLQSLYPHLRTHIDIQTSEDDSNDVNIWEVPALDRSHTVWAKEERCRHYFVLFVLAVPLILAMFTFCCFKFYSA